LKLATTQFIWWLCDLVRKSEVEDDLLCVGGLMLPIGGNGKRAKEKVVGDGSRSLRKKTRLPVA